MAESPKPSFLRLVTDAQDAPQGPDERLRRAFPEPHLAAWLRAVRRLEDAGYGTSVVRAYQRFGLEAAETLGPDAGIDLADLVSTVAIKAGRETAQSLCAAAAFAARHLGALHRYRSWLGLMQRFAGLAPESLDPLIRRMEALLPELGVSGLEAWILAGVRLAGADAARRRAYFSFEDPDATRWARREAGELLFSAVEGRMKLYLAALFGVRAPIVEPGPSASEAARRRASFAEGVIRMPPSFPGYRGQMAEDLFRAALAHIGAHRRHGGPRFPIGKLKPVQIALVSLIEDARVERLAMAEMPGLRRLWLPFHIAHPGGLDTAPGLMARLARALIDPSFSDQSAWVTKGRALFEAMVSAGRLEEPALSREIGNVLGNDLGQMRVQFNAKSFVAEPPYRDDNLGLWEPPDPEDGPQEEIEILLDAARPTPPEEDQPPDREEEERDDAEQGETAPRAKETLVEDAIPIARYPEYDYEIGRERPEWATALDCALEPGAPDRIAAILDQRAPLAARLTRLIQAARVGRVQRLRRQPEGDALDLDVAVEAMIDLRGGKAPEANVYRRAALLRRDLAVHVLLDISQSTADRPPGLGGSILDLEREAVALLAYAMEGLGDPFAATAFNSDGREAVRTYRVKGFGEPFDRAAWGRLAGLRPGYSTRMGAALRHAAAEMAGQRSHRRLVLLVTDGEPSDIDCPDPKYLIEDARSAVQRLAASGIDAFCVALGAGHQAALARIFGKNIARISDIATLPRRLPALYLRLSR